MQNTVSQINHLDDCSSLHENPNPEGYKNVDADKIIITCLYKGRLLINDHFSCKTFYDYDSYVTQTVRYLL